MQGWIESEQLQSAKKDYNKLVLQIADAIVMPEKVDIKATLKRGKQVAEQDIQESG